ncbi:F-box/kelch-repeat protein At3g06240-like [Quercus robur]|uniref:F-box/kelch-repeat protein At3g06240-like n=1 Tax=Quercus robur TaxID=38942 RepID=UPI0021621108|nr:F-box/kelch-repeat protein At3g06240-like [Quercus robur]
MAAAAKPQPQLPEDMVEEILLRQPVKSLLRFSCVSKLWHALITSPKFTRILLSQNRMNMVVLTNDCIPQIFDYEALLYPPQNNNGDDDDVVCDEGSEFGAIDEALLYPQNNNHVVYDEYSEFGVDVGFPLRGANNEDVYTKLSSCNGLVCVEFFNWKRKMTEVLLWNPSTRSYREIPRSRPTPLSSEYFSFGFGYDYSTDDYKILRPYRFYQNTFQKRLKFNLTADDFQIEMFSLKTFSWRTIQDQNNICTQKLSPSPYNNISLNGAIYWIVKPHNKPSIIYFDLAGEIFHELPWPCAEIFDCHYSELGIFGQHLCLSVTDEINLCVELWVMKESSWTRLLTIPYWRSLKYCPRPIFLSNRNNIGELLMLDSNPDIYLGMNLTMYNLKENTHRTIFRPRQPKQAPYEPPIIAIATYIESLYSLYPT